MSEVVAVIGVDGRIADVGSGAAFVLGRGAHELVGRDPVELVDEADRPRLVAALADGGGRVRARPPDGRDAWVAVQVHRPDPRPAAPAGELVLVIRDVSELVWAERQEQAAEARYAALTEDLADVVFAADADGLLTHFNPSFVRQTGIGVSDVVGLHILDLVQPDQRPAAEVVLGALLSGEMPVGYFEGRYHSVVLGRLGWFEARIRLVRDDRDVMSGFIGVISDVTERKEAVAELAHKARHDGLTGLLNRSAVVDHLTVTLSTATSGHVAVLFADLDRFKQVNDRLGHEAGDALLVDVGERLWAALRDGEVAGRLGGDEFVIVSEGHASERPEGAVLAAGRR